MYAARTLLLAIGLVATMLGTTVAAASPGSRLTYLDEQNPYYPHPTFPRLTTPMWVGEEGVDAVILLSIDDMGRVEGNRFAKPPVEFEQFFSLPRWR